MKEGTHVNTVDAKNRLNELLAEVNRTKKPVIIEKRGNAVAVLLDYETFERGKPEVARMGKRNDPLLKEMTAFHERLRKKYPKGTGDSVEILREIRQERALS